GCGLECTQPVSEGMSFSKVEGVVRALGGKASVDPYLPDDMVVAGSVPTPDAGAAKPDGAVIATPDAPLPVPDAAVVATPDAPITVPTTVAGVVKALPADGTAVTLPEVVVVGNELRTNGSLLYVQDRGGGEYSGLMIFCNTTTCKPS